MWPTVCRVGSTVRMTSVRALTVASCCQRRGGRRRVDPGMAQLQKMLEATNRDTNDTNPLQNAPLPSAEQLRALETSLNSGRQLGTAAAGAASDAAGQARTEATDGERTAVEESSVESLERPRRRRGVRANRKRREGEIAVREQEMQEMQAFLEKNKHLMADVGRWSPCTDFSQIFVHGCELC